MGAFQRNDEKMNISWVEKMAHSRYIFQCLLYTKRMTLEAATRNMLLLMIWCITTTSGESNVLLLKNPCRKINFMKLVPLTIWMIR